VKLASIQYIIHKVQTSIVLRTKNFTNYGINRIFNFLPYVIKILM